jgi:hypothetical protein
MWPRVRRPLVGLFRPAGAGLIATTVVLASLSAQAGAETAIPSQALADDGGFLPYAPAPSQRTGLCLVDTGVSVNADTESGVVERSAIDGGSGDDASPTHHGTVLAMMATGAVNGWGMVGVAPAAVQVVSVRILQPGESDFPFSAYAAAVTACLEVRRKYDIRVINLSLGDPEGLSSRGNEVVANAMCEAQGYGVAVVAAAGNDDGGPIAYPAAYPGVLSVGASDAVSGAFCGFSNRGEDLRLLAPGCELDGADPLTGAASFNYWQGTSEASVITSAALAALLAFRPDLSSESGVQALTAYGGRLDVGRTFRDAGLGAIVSAGEAAEPRAPAPASAENPLHDVQPSSPMPLKLRFAQPHAALRHIRRHLVLTVFARPHDALLQVRLLARSRHARGVHVVRTLRGAFSKLVLRRGLSQVLVRFVDPYDAARDGPWTTLKITARG